MKISVSVSFSDNINSKDCQLQILDLRNNFALETGKISLVLMVKRLFDKWSKDIFKMVPNNRCYSKPPKCTVIVDT